MVFLDKPRGWTSRRAVNELVRLFTREGGKRVKAGHAGTLDPLATGMLPVLLGEATRFADVGLDADKRYVVTADLSRQTDTLDDEGETVARFAAMPEREDIERALAGLRGDIMQVPPAYSAVHVDGRRAHELARRGDAVRLEARPVHVRGLALLEWTPPMLTLAVTCSKGTYVRSLARDLGEALGVGGCVTRLRRLSTGGWPEALMLPFEDIRRLGEQCVMPLSQWLRHLPRLALEEAEARRFVQGQRIQMPEAGETARPGEVAVFLGDVLLGTGELRPGLRRMVLHPKKGLPSARRALGL